MALAVRSGATALLVADTLASLYTNATSAAAIKLSDACAVDCAVGRGTVSTSSLTVDGVLYGLEGRCPPPSGYIGRPCSTPLCAFSGPPPTAATAAAGDEREVCCVLERPPPPTMTDTIEEPVAPPLPAVSISLSLARLLATECALTKCSLTLAVAPPPPPRWDRSSIIVWALATGTAALAAYLAAHAHHEQDNAGESEHMQGSGGGGGGGEAPAAFLDSSTAFGFLLMASTGLIGLYLLIQALHIKDAVITLINIAFILGTAGATSTLFTTPLTTTILPSRLGSTPIPLPCCIQSLLGVSADLPLSSLLGLTIAFSLSIYWYLHKTLPWVWLLQDGLSISLCLLFVRTLRLPSLRIASLFLGLMFFYDIFMVFISRSSFTAPLLWSPSLRPAHPPL